jgi:hypothetical protein
MALQTSKSCTCNLLLCSVNIGVSDSQIGLHLVAFCCPKHQ